MVQNSQSKERMSSVTHSLQHFDLQIISEHDGKVSISSRNIIDLQFADDIDAVVASGGRTGTRSSS